MSTKHKRPRIVESDEEATQHNIERMITLLTNRIDTFEAFIIKHIAEIKNGIKGTKRDIKDIMEEQEEITVDVKKTKRNIEHIMEEQTAGQAEANAERKEIMKVLQDMKDILKTRKDAWLGATTHLAYTQNLY